MVARINPIWPLHLVSLWMLAAAGASAASDEAPSIVGDSFKLNETGKLEVEVFPGLMLDISFALEAIDTIKKRVQASFETFHTNQRSAIENGTLLPEDIERHYVEVALDVIRGYKEQLLAKLEPEERKRVQEPIKEAGGSHIFVKFREMLDRVGKQVQCLRSELKELQLEDSVLLAPEIDDDDDEESSLNSLEVVTEAERPLGRTAPAPGGRSLKRAVRSVSERLDSIKERSKEFAKQILTQEAQELSLILLRQHTFKQVAPSDQITEIVWRIQVATVKYLFGVLTDLFDLIMCHMADKSMKAATA